MEAFTKKDIVLFPFPFTDLTQRKLRPCLVLSEEMNEDIILCQITSQNIERDEYSIEVQKNETLNGSLTIDSLIRCNMIFTADKKQIQRKICIIKNEKYEQVVEKINEIIKKAD